MGGRFSKKVLVNKASGSRAEVGLSPAVPQPPPILYYLSGSAPSRTALMTARNLGLDVEVRVVDLLSGEHLKEDFVKLNPQHTVPTLDDNGFVLWESRAIATYLATKFGQTDALYPKDAQRRAVVDQRLYFDATALYASLFDIAAPLIASLATSVPEEKKARLAATVALLDGFLEGSRWAAGHEMTVADIALASTVTSIQALGYDLSQQGNVTAWLERCKDYMRGFAENLEGATLYGELVLSKHGGPIFQ